MWPEMHPLQQPACPPQHALLATLVYYDVLGGPSFTPLLTPPPHQQQAAASTWSPWTGAWDQQSLTNSFSTIALTPPVVIDWVADSDASNHTNSDEGNLTSIHPPTSTDPSFIIVGNGSALWVTSVGDSALLDPFYLNNVLVTLDIIQNCLSVYRFTTNNWCSMEFDPFNLSVKDLSTQNVITRCNSSRPLYTMRLTSHLAPSSHVAAPLALVASVSTWHRRIGHPGVDVLSKLSHDSSVIYSRHTHDLYHACQLGRYTGLPFIRSNSRADNNFDLIHCDLWTSPIVSISGCKILSSYP
jgi:hypothetical protein